jgi:murein DD-endopeptidase MepM/ murein hydrolase activator NlpD
MSQFDFINCSRLGFRLALTGIAAGMLAGCASSERLNDAFSNPFQTSAIVADQAPAAAAPVSPVQSQPLGAPAASSPGSSSANPWRPNSAPPSPRMASAAPSRTSQAVAGWTVEGGSPMTIAPGENGEILARRYGIPLDALVRANGFATASQLQPGARVVIPVYNAALAAASGVRVPAASTSRQAVASASHAAKVKILQGGTRKVAASAPIEKSPQKPEKISARAKAVKAAAAPAQDVAREPAKKLVATAKPPIAAQSAKQEPEKVAKTEAPIAEAKKPAHDKSADVSKASADANPEFRWPARGRIIQAFKPGGNDGINIAVPEGTSVKAAESGVVAYAGSELKGYGNLILIRHPNGFVSAYANNGDIEVKRGETVKRGQTIAKSGQSGNVASPQLHFELRKGATPVDPTLYLARL